MPSRSYISFYIQAPGSSGLLLPMLPIAQRKQLMLTRPPLTYRLDPENSWYPDLEDLHNQIRYNPNIIGNTDYQPR